MGLRTSIAVAALLHVVGIMALLYVTVRRLPPPIYITLAPPDAGESIELPPYREPEAGVGRTGAERPVVPDSPPQRGQTTSDPPPAPPPLASDDLATQPDSGARRSPPDSQAAKAPAADNQPADELAAAAAAAAATLSELASSPSLGDGSAWVSPRPPLPGEVADVIYGSANKDTAVVRRLRAMIDTLNRALDSVQRQEQIPTWTREIAGTKFGIDSQFIHVAGIKIPTAALALLPITLPQGNYGEMARSFQLEEMREDIIRSAQRTQTIADFRRYVKELRARKDAEREAARRARERQPEDTTPALP